MATFSVTFLGCKVSHNDAQEIRERLIQDGHRVVQGPADVAVVNTCCVTNEAVRKSRQAARRAARQARTVYVTGCGANLQGDLFGEVDANVRIVRLPSEETPRFVAGDVGAIGCVRANIGLDRVRAFVKIQDGCSFGCSFCVIPNVRGASRSRPAERVLAEVALRASQGHKEVVLTGINLGCYRDRQARFDLARLVREAGSTSGLERLRLSSVEVNHLTDDLIAAMAETGTVSPHLHVPLQSGDDAVLAAMKRRYSAESYLRRVRKAAGFNLTTDVIVGFPAEDDGAFENTLRIVEAAGVTKVHVFPYSPRPGTQTESLDSVPPGIKKQRSARLRAISASACRRWWAEKIGDVDDVLVDRPGCGYGRDYSPWLVDGEVSELVRVRGVGVEDSGVVGVPA